MRYDSLGRRADRHCPISTGRRVRLTDRDLLWMEKLHRHGPLPSSYLHAYAGTVADNTVAKRLTLLSSEDATIHGGRYLTRPHQQFATMDARHQQLVFDLTPAAKSALHEAGRFRKFAPTTSNRSWKHDHMAACIAASIELATREELDRFQYIFHDEVVAKVGREYFTALDSKVVPDRWGGIRFLDRGGVLLFAIEADCGTEPLTSANARKSIARNVSQYEAWIEGGRYKQDLGTSGGIVVLNVTGSRTRMYSMVGTAERTLRHGTASYLLFNYMPDFGSVYKPPKPWPELFFGTWYRTGLPEYNVSKLA